jgi:hypothetical protein
VSRYPLAIQNNLVKRPVWACENVLSNGLWIPLQHLTTDFPALPLETNLHSPQRRLIELQMEHSDLDALIDYRAEDAPVDELMLRRLKKRRLALRDDIARLQSALQPDEPA